MKTIFDTETLIGLVYVILIDGQAVCVSKVLLDQSDTVLFVSAIQQNAREFCKSYNKD